MRWLRENWLDFLIFVLIAVVAVGVVLYLVGLNPFAARPAPPPAPQAPAATAPGPAGEAPAEEPVVTVLPLPEALAPEVRAGGEVGGGEGYEGGKAQDPDGEAQGVAEELQVLRPKEDLPQDQRVGLEGPHPQVGHGEEDPAPGEEGG